MRESSLTRFMRSVCFFFSCATRFFFLPANYNTFPLPVPFFASSFSSSCFPFFTTQSPLRLLGHSTRIFWIPPGFRLLLALLTSLPSSSLCSFTHPWYSCASKSATPLLFARDTIGASLWRASGIVLLYFPEDICTQKVRENNGLFGLSDRQN